MKSHCILFRLGWLQLTLLNEILKKWVRPGNARNTVQQNGHSQKYWKWLFRTNYRLMQVIRIAECSKGSILQYFRPSIGYQLSLRPFILFIFEWPFYLSFTVFRLTHGTMKNRHRTRTPTQLQELYTIKTTNSNWQWINNNSNNRTIALERTVSGINNLIGKFFALNSAVIKYNYCW